MKIAVYVSGSDVERDYLFQLFTAYALQHSNDEVLFITHRSINQAHFSKNVMFEVVEKKPSSVWAANRFYKKEIKNILQQHRCTHFVHGEMLTISLCIPTYTLLDKIPEYISWWSAWIHQSALKKSKKVWVTRMNLLQTLRKKYGLSDERRIMVRRGISSVFQPIAWHETSAFKDKFTEGKEYFLVPVCDHNKEHLRTLLKAYTIFKKWQHSSIQIVLLLRTKESEVPLVDFHQYKYRQNVKVFHQPTLEDEALLTAGAFAWIGMEEKDDLLLEMLQAMQCEVPILWSGKKHDLPSDVFLSFEPTEKVLAEKMMVVYKEEAAMGYQKAQAKAYVRQFSLENSLVDLSLSTEG